jgi:hypothetical protein
MRLAGILSARGALMQPPIRPQLLLKIRRLIAGKRNTHDGLQFVFDAGGNRDFAYLNLDSDPQSYPDCALIVILICTWKSLTI